MPIFNVVIFWIHILSAVTWIGGMIFNLLVVRPSMAMVDPSKRLILVDRILRRFITVVWISLGLLILTGLPMTLRRIVSFEMLFETRYGKILMLKLAVVLAMIAIVALIRYKLLPKFESLMDTQSPELTTVAGQMVSLVKINLTFGIFVLLLAELLAFA